MGQKEVQMNVSDAIKTAMAALSDNYRDFAVTKTKFDIWMQILGDLQPRSIELATLHFLSDESPWAPVVGQFRAVAVKIEHGEPAEFTAAESWDRISAYIQHKEIELNELEKKVLRATKGIWDLRRSSNIEMDRLAYVKYYTELVNGETERRKKLPIIRENESKKRLESGRDPSVVVNRLVGKMEASN